MTDAELRERMKACLAGWKEIDAFREAESFSELPQTDTASMLGAFNGMALAHVRRFPAEPTSGLIEQQRLFGLARSKRSRSV